MKYSAIEVADTDSAQQSTIVGPMPETTIDGPTLTVAATTNYTGDTIDNVTAITFASATGATATFEATQFSGLGISFDATITGDTHTDIFKVDVGQGEALNAAHLQFSHWTASDKFEIAATGDGVTIAGTAGNDIISTSIQHLDGSDSINGDAGTNTLDLSGGSSSDDEVTAGMLQNIQKIVLGSGGPFQLTFDTGVVAAGQMMTIDAKNVDSDSIFIALQNDTTGSYKVEFGKDNNNEVLLNGQTDIIDGEAGQVLIYAGPDMSKSDKIVGGENTTLFLSGDFSGGYTFGAHELTNLSAIGLAVGSSYKLETNDANVAAGATLTVNGNMLVAGNSFTFNGSHETNGSFDIYAGAGFDRLTGGTQHDTFWFGTNDPLTAADRIDGGGGSDALNISGNYSASLKFESGTISNIAFLELGSGFSYNFTLHSGNVTSGQNLAIDASDLSSANVLDLNASKIGGDDAVTIYGGAGNDVITGDSGSASYFTGNGGADTLIVKGGEDIFYYNAVSDSTGSAYDDIINFDANRADIRLTGSHLSVPTAIDTAVTAGNLGASGFNSKLAADIGAQQLHAHDAVLFTPDSGGLAGHTFLIVDENGVAGYQANKDIVIELTHTSNMADFSLNTFFI